MAITNRALAFASRWFDEATVRRTFEPLIADWQREWQDASGARRPWVSLRGLSAFICAVAISSPTIIATPVPPSISWRVAKRIAVFCVVIAGALSIPMLRSRDPIEQEAPLWAAMLLMAIPAAVTIAFPFAMVMAVDAIRRDAGVAPQVERAAALKLGVIAVCFMLAAGGVVAPLASREWRALSTPAGWNTPQPRVQQLSTVALLTHPERNTAIVPGHYTRAGEIRRELIQRLVLSVLPALFVWLRWTALGQPRRRFWPLPAAAMTAIVIVGLVMTTFAGSTLEYKWALQPGTGLALPLIAFGVWTLAEQRFARRSGRTRSAAPHEA
jgi:hypothetical protein